MKTIITIEVEHTKPMPHLANMVAGRAWSIDGVKHAEVVLTPDSELLAAGFTRRELALGHVEVERA
jgi:hypothetical protein